MNKDQIADSSFGIVMGLVNNVNFPEAVSLLTTSLGIILSMVPDSENVTNIKNEISNFIAEDIIHDSDQKQIFHVEVVDDKDLLNAFISGRN